MRALIVFALVFPPQSGRPPSGKPAGLPRSHLVASAVPPPPGWGTFLRKHRRWVIAVGVVLALVLVYPPVVGGLAASMFASKVTERLGRPVTVARGRAGLTQVALRGILIEGRAGGPPLLTASEIAVPFAAVLGRGGQPVVISDLRIHAVRGGADDNVEEIIARLTGRGRAPSSGPAPQPKESDPKGSDSKDSDKSETPIPAVAIESGSLFAKDGERGLTLQTASIKGVFTPSQQVSFQLGGVSGALGFADSDKGPRFGAKELHVRSALSGMRPTGYPNVIVKDGFATPLPSLSLTGIAGTVGPPPVGVASKAGDAIVVDLHGSYGGAKETLWTARGGANPATQQGRLALRAEQFSLGKIPDILPKSVLRPEDSSIDASFELLWAGDALTLGGEMAVVGLSLQHEGLASLPIDNLSMSVNMKATAFPAARRLQIEYVQGRVRDLVGRLSGSIELAPGTFKFADGSRLGVLPKIDLAFVVPPISCSKLLESIPMALISNLQGFQLKGMFEAKIGTKIDFSDLEALELRGKVGIDGCKVKEAPETVTMLAGPQPILQTVEVPKAPGPKVQPGETEMIQFVIGPDNPDFVPFVQISPHLINSIMTTEDNGFFKHRGWVTSEFKSALRRNLARGGFRLGASSITMQMTKNVLLSKEKTLSRKLQELFLVWYLEQELPKERILELYFNAIEFGPRLYGIGPAARHYFGKKAADLTPLEAAFFSSILPSPKRRYIQFCHGSLFPPWEKYVRRIMAKVYERGRLTEAEFTEASLQKLTFDRREATFNEKQCLEWVKKMTTRPEAEPPPDLDNPDGDDDASTDARGGAAKRGVSVRGASKRGSGSSGARPKSTPRN